MTMTNKVIVLRDQAIGMLNHLYYLYDEDEEMVCDERCGSNESYERSLAERKQLKKEIDRLVVDLIDTFKI